MCIQKWLLQCQGAYIGAHKSDLLEWYGYVNVSLGILFLTKLTWSGKFGFMN